MNTQSPTLGQQDEFARLGKMGDEFARQVNKQLAGVRDPDIILQVIGELRFNSPAVIAHLLSQIVEDPLGQFDGTDKVFWAEVADHMGCTLETMRTKLAFMRLVNGFNARSRAE